MFGLTTTAKLKEARDAAIKLKAERDNARAARDTALERVEAEKHRAKQFGRLNSELLAERDAAIARAEAAEGELKRRADQARANFAKGRKNRSKKIAGTVAKYPSDEMLVQSA